MGSKFNEVKVGDKIFKAVSGFGKSFYIGEVVHVTKTRFKVDFGGNVSEYTKDGDVYPRETGWNRVSVRIDFLNEDNLKVAQKDLSLRKLLTLSDSIVEDVRYLRENFESFELEEVQSILIKATETKREIKETIGKIKNGGNNE